MAQKWPVGKQKVNRFVHEGMNHFSNVEVHLKTCSGNVNTHLKTRSGNVNIT